MRLRKLWCVLRRRHGWSTAVVGDGHYDMVCGECWHTMATGESQRLVFQGRVRPEKHG